MFHEHLKFQPRASAACYGHLLKESVENNFQQDQRRFNFNTEEEDRLLFKEKLNSGKDSVLVS